MLSPASELLSWSKMRLGSAGQPSNPVTLDSKPPRPAPSGDSTSFPRLPQDTFVGGADGHFAESATPLASGRKYGPNFAQHFTQEPQQHTEPQQYIEPSQSAQTHMYGQQDPNTSNLASCWEAGNRAEHLAREQRLSREDQQKAYKAAFQKERRKNPGYANDQLKKGRERRARDRGSGG